MLEYIIYDVKKAIWKWSVMGLFPLLYVIALIMTFDMPMSVAIMNLMNALMPLLLMVVFADQFSADYINKTYKTLFTGIYTREALLFGKLLACLLIALLFGFIHWFMPVSIILAEGSPFIVSEQLRTLIQTELAYFAASVCLSSFCLMMGVFSKKFTITFVVCFVLFYDLIAQAMGVVASSAQRGSIQLIAALLPFQMVPLVLTTQQITGLQAVILITSGIGFLVVGMTRLSQQECY